MRNRLFTAPSTFDNSSVSDFHHVRINHSQLFAEDRNHINGIENFWNQAKRHLRRYNGIPKHHFHFYLNPHFPSIVDIQCGEKAILL